jgi:hypothetical protein
LRQRLPGPLGKVILLSIPRGPDFLGVGPEKTGTSWMYEQLAAHPDVWMHPVGELRYFWEDAHHPREPFYRRFADDAQWHHSQYRTYARRVAKLALRSPGSLFQRGGQLRRDLSYLFAVHDDDWYVRQFPQDPQRIRGEVSPQYFFLPEVQIERISRLLPECRILISLREPVSWIWSFVRMLEKNGTFARFGSLEAFVLSRFDGRSFAGSVAAWQRHFGERASISFYDDLCRDPWGYYVAMCERLGIEPDPARQGLATQKINSGRERPIDPRHAAFIRRIVRPDLEKLEDMGIALPPGWLD